MLPLMIEELCFLPFHGIALVFIGVCSQGYVFLLDIYLYKSVISIFLSTKTQENDIL